MANGLNPRAEQFSTALRGHLTAQNLAVHALARRIADNRHGGHAPRKLLEQVRRDLNRYLSGRFNPGPKKRREIAFALGLEPDAMDEEEDVMELLYDAIRRTIQKRRETGDPGAVLR